MLFRFCLYGFLKNQRYFEPFLVVVFLDRGLSFTAIGSLVAAQQLVVNLLEIPSGVLADRWGRRRALLLAFGLYLGGLLLWGLSAGLLATGAAALLFAAGDAFRSGAHKALIFAWLRQNGRESERTRVYGLTRSWSKIGSAVSIAIGAGLVIARGTFEVAFLATLLPYVASVVNLAGYPASIDVSRGPAAPERSRLAWRDAFRRIAGNRGLRGLLGESMGFDGPFGAVKDYLQPALLGIAGGGLTALFAGRVANAPEVARLVAPAYLGLALLASVASRHAHRWEAWAGGEAEGARRVWVATTATYAGLLVAGWMAYLPGVVAAFLILYAIQNLWRPIVVSRLDHLGELGQATTTLSIDSQARRLATMILAPLLGMAVDALRVSGRSELFAPLGAVGLIVSAYFLVRSRRSA